MTQKTLLFNINVIFFTTFILIACSNSKNELNQKDSTKNIKTDTIIDKKIVYTKIDNLIVETIKRRKKDKSDYTTEDSLNYYFSKLSPDDLFEDNDFKLMTGKLLEYSYSETRKEALRPETFPVYNMSLVTYGIRSSSFALNIITKMQRNKNASYKEYSRTGQEFVCIDTVVLALDKIPKMKNDSIHKICMDLVKKNKTGGCKW